MAKNKRELHKKIQKRKAEAANLNQKKMIHKHQDVLQNIEFAIISQARKDLAIDDSNVLAAIHCFLAKESSDHPLTQKLVEALKEFRTLRTDITDSVWNDGLRVVARSVKTHSTATPGSKGYLNFAGQFIL